MTHIIKTILLFTMMFLLFNCGKEKNAILHIKADITDAVVYVDGNKQKGVAPMDVFVSEGVHEIKVVSNKYTDCIFEQSLVIRAFEEKGIYTKLYELVEFEKEKERVKMTSEEIKNNMVLVKGGAFDMGSNEGDGDEKPIHRVTVGDFYMGATEVTQIQWKTVMGNNPSRFKGNNLPVESVSWNEVQKFIKKLNKQSGENYRLPTEAEWEYASRGISAGEDHKWSGTSTESELTDYAWYYENWDGNYSGREVGTKLPNGNGLYDMSGNVWEWCSDWYSSNYYSSSPQNDPQGPGSGSGRVIRGGSYFNGADLLRCANRDDDFSGSTNFDVGFRISRD